MNIALAGDSAGEGLAGLLAEDLGGDFNSLTCLGLTRALINFMQTSQIE